MLSPAERAALDESYLAHCCLPNESGVRVRIESDNEEKRALVIAIRAHPDSVLEALEFAFTYLGNRTRFTRQCVFGTHVLIDTSNPLYRRHIALLMALNRVGLERQRLLDNAVRQLQNGGA